LTRLPRRSAIVAFSTEQVYAIAELIRRQRGGAAVVMGSLSPRTRNAQVALFQSGEVDFLVATEPNLMWQLQKRFPQHHYHGVPGISCACNKCPHMALNTLEKLRDCLENMSPKIEWQPFFDKAGEVLRRSLLQ
jgi:quinolinate synthase